MDQITIAETSAETNKEIKRVGESAPIGSPVIQICKCMSMCVCACVCVHVCVCALAHTPTTINLSNLLLESSKFQAP